MILNLPYFVQRKELFSLFLEIIENEINLFLGEETFLEHILLLMAETVMNKST